MRVGHRTCEMGQPRHGLGGVYGLIVVPKSIEMTSFSSRRYISFGGASIVKVKV